MTGIQSSRQTDIEKRSVRYVGFLVLFCAALAGCSAINEASRMTRPSGGGLRNEVEQSRLLPMILAHAAFVAAILNEKT